MVMLAKLFDNFAGEEDEELVGATEQIATNRTNNDAVIEATPIAGVLLLPRFANILLIVLSPRN